jgi:hypothetical protein
MVLVAAFEGHGLQVEDDVVSDAATTFQDCSSLPGTLSGAFGGKFGLQIGTQGEREHAISEVTSSGGKIEYTWVNIIGVPHTGAIAEKLLHPSLNEPTKAAW